MKTTKVNIEYKMLKQVQHDIRLSVVSKRAVCHPELVSGSYTTNIMDDKHPDLNECY